MFPQASTGQSHTSTGMILLLITISKEQLYEYMPFGQTLTVKIIIYLFDDSVLYSITQSKNLLMKKIKLLNFKSIFEVFSAVKSSQNRYMNCTLLPLVHAEIKQ